MTTTTQQASTEHASTRERLAELGFELPAGAAPVASYVPAVRAGSIVYTSGQLPAENGVLAATGKVGDGITADQAAGLAATCVLNALAAAGTQGDLDSARILKVVGFVASAPGFSGQPAVVNGASELLLQVFGERGQHARSAVGVAELPLDAPVEVELVLEFS
ncbi:LysR family transcriptional regulator [Arthrobacter sp. SW1]|uniref:RidA family protein n=1 Tax=Arthrobacter sp. SW1 TaxID=1920889 RepID=UPI000877CC9E|nr:RidA family protein [Arthrobacter sp. SW1]OFI39517.1 LysR family transcriptional regulator [Arthrobacter sp. SW1]